MRLARDAIQAHPGGAARCNVFTRALLALYGFLPWRSVPVMPVEIMLLPRWFPFHLDKISYWGRTVIVPLLVLMTLKPKAKNPRGVRIDELFEAAARDHRAARSARRTRSAAGSRSSPRSTGCCASPSPTCRRRSGSAPSTRAVAWVGERLNGEDGLGAIYPAMANSVMMYDVLGYPEDHPQRAAARRSLDKLLVIHADEAYCQPCVSPIWDTGLACHALLETGDERAQAQVRKALDWLVPKQVLDVKGDWAARRPNVRPGGWAFQYANPHYPDVDDTAVVAMAMDRAQGASPGSDFAPAIARAKEWIYGMQSRNGAWGAFDADNEFYYLNNIPFADHGALLDPPTEDVTARCLSMLAQLGDTARQDPGGQARASTISRRTQLPDGSWYGRWGMNYIYGTWSVLCALNAAGIDHAAPEMRKAAAWLIAHPERGRRLGRGRHELQARLQGLRARAEHRVTDRLGAARPDGGGRGRHPAVARGIDYLARHAGRRRLLERAALHRDRFPARVLSALPRLFEVLPALGAGALPQPAERQRARGRVRDVRGRLPAVRQVGRGRGYRSSIAWAIKPRRSSTVPTCARILIVQPGRPRSGGAPLVRRPEARSQPASFARLERECVQDQAKRKERAERQSEQPSSALIFHDTALPPVSSGRKPAGSMARCYLTRTQLRRG